MREEVSLLLETVRQWIDLDADGLLLYDGDDAPSAQIPLERRVLGLVWALSGAVDRGEGRSLRLVLPASDHPLCRSWSVMPTLRRHIRRLAEGTPALAWLEEAPARWAMLQAAVSWLPDAAALEPVYAQAAATLRADPRTAGLPAGLTLEFLAWTILQVPAEPALRARALDDAALQRVLSGGAERLVEWAAEAGPARRELRRLALPAPVHRALASAPSVTAEVSVPMIRWPSQMLCPEAEVIPFQASWSLEAALLEWCSEPDWRGVRALVGPAGSGKRRLAHELRQHLHTLGWSSTVLSPDAPPSLEPGRDHLVIVSDLPEHIAEVRALLAGAGGQRVRVLGLAEGAGEWLSKLPTIEVLRPEPVPPEARAARLRLAASALARRSGQKLPWVMALPDLAAMSRPLQLHLAALGGLRGIAQRSPALGALETERRAWRRAGVDQQRMSSDLVDAALGIRPWPGSYAEIPLPVRMVGALVVERLREDPEPLQRAEPKAALALLDLLAEVEPAARDWMRVLLGIDPEARQPLAAAIVSQRSADPRARPLGGLLAEQGYAFASAATVSAPMRVLTVHFSRQVLGGWRETLAAGPPVALAANAGGRPSRPPAARQPEAPLAEQVWGCIRRRLDVVLPHQVRALDLLDQEHRGSPHESLARQRIALLAELCIESPSAAVFLEGAVNDLGALLLAGHLSPEAAPLVSDGLSEDERRQARAANRQLHEAFAHRGARNNAAAVEALSEAARLLRGLSQRHPALIASDLLHTTLEMAALGRSLGRPREAAATLQALLAPLEQLTADYPPHWPRRSTILGNLALLQRVSDHPREARRLAEQAVAAAPAHDTSELGRLDRIAALRTLICCDDEARAAPRWAELLDIITALSAYRPELYLPCLAVEHDRAARAGGTRETARAHLEASAAALAGLSSLDEGLYAPFQGLSLHNLGARLRVLGAHQAATDATLGAAEAYRRQARLGGETFLPDLSMTLSNLGAMLATDGQLSQALALTRKSISVCWGGAPPEALARMPSIRRLLIEEIPSLPGTPASLVVRPWMREGSTRRRPYFLWHLSLIAAALREGEGDLSERIAAVWRFEVSNPEQLRPGLATALHNLGVLLGLGGQTAAGAEALEGAAAVLRVCSMDAPEQGTRDLALALADLSALRDLLEDAEAADAAAAEALSLLPASETAARAQALLNRSAALLALGRHAAAIRCASEATELAEEAGLPAVRVAALHNLAAAALAASQPTVAYEASRDALRASPPDTPPGQRALIAETHRSAASAARRNPTPEALVEA